MKTRILALAVIAALAGATVATAAGVTNRFATKFKSGGNDVGKVSFNIKTNSKGVAKKVTSLRVTNAQTQCVGAKGGVTPGPKVSRNFPGRYPVKKGVDGSKVFHFQTPTIRRRGFDLTVSANLKTGKGRAVKDGRVEVSNVNKSVRDCSVTGHFKAKRK